MSCAVTVCRGCCCGTVEKHPEVDHDGQLAVLREGLPAGSRVVVADCLSACERSNVMVVSPGRAARRSGARPAAACRCASDGSASFAGIGKATTSMPATTAEGGSRWERSLRG